MKIHDAGTLIPLHPMESGNATTEGPEGSNSEDPQLKQVCQDFESIFMAEMMRTMRRTLPKSELLRDGLGGSHFRELFDQELASKMSRSNGLGLAEVLYKEFSGETRSVATARGMTIEAYRRTAVPVWSSRDTVSRRIGRFDRIIRSAAKTYGVNPNLIRALIAQESGGDPRAVSRKGAKGLMQLMDETAAALGVRDAMDARENIFGGTRYLSTLLHRFDGDMKLALASYNAGPGAVERYGGIPPFGETRHFVRRVLEHFETHEAK